MRKSLIPTVALLTFGAGAALCLAAAPARQPVAEIHPVWSTANWPFAMDRSASGKAFTCTASDCGSQISVYLRPKIGFCNRTNGFADDEDLEHLADFDLFRNDQKAAAPGRPIQVRCMKGRMAGVVHGANVLRGRHARSP